MEFNWFTFVAQLVNFLVLVLLLRKFLYGPIVNAMSAREQGIADRLAEAERRQQDAAREADALRAKNEQLDEQRESLLTQARDEAEQRRRELLREAREAVEQSRQEWNQAFHRQQESLRQEVRQETAQMAVEIARRALRQLADDDLQDRIVSLFVRQLRGLDEEKREQLTHELGDGDGRIFVRAAFPLSEQAQGAVRSILVETFPSGSDVTSREDAGIALQVGGHQVAWSVEEFLDSLEEEVDHRVIQGSHERI